MSKVLENIGEEALQRHEIIFGGREIVLTLRFLPRNSIWVFDVEYAGAAVYGLKMTVGPLHMVSSNFPFDFICIDTSGEGIDPFRRQDFSEGRCVIVMLEAADMESIRGVPVP